MRDSRRPERRGGGAGGTVLVASLIAVVVIGGIAAAIYFGSGLLGGGGDDPPPAPTAAVPTATPVLPARVPEPTPVSTPTPIPEPTKKPAPPPTPAVKPTSPPPSAKDGRPVIPQSIIDRANTGILLSSGWVDNFQLQDGESGTVWHISYVTPETGKTTFLFIVYAGEPLRAVNMVEVREYEARKDPTNATVTFYNPGMPDRVVTVKMTTVGQAKSGTFTVEQNGKFAKDSPKIFSSLLRYNLKKDNLTENSECDVALDPLEFANGDGYRCLIRDTDNAAEALKQIRLLIEKVEQGR